MRGQFKGEKINEDVEKSRKALINEAKKEPINMLVDSPDPHGQQFDIFHYVVLSLIHFSITGVGGTTDTANTGRRFYGEKREQFLDLVDVSTALHF